jgi:23S rRNA (cytosine1962-C5)-methyltransferase
VGVLVSALPPCVLHEDDDLLVVHKPAGVNTHAPAPYAGEGIYDWLRHREARWADLAIVHRLDKDTSGVLVFSKTERANRSLTEQFARRQVHKQYRLLTDRAVPPGPFVIRSSIVRQGDRYVAREGAADGQPAETHFRVVSAVGARTLVEAEPVTGRTHQIRVHAAWKGFPVLGDAAYGGSPHARVCLHARQLAFRHPASGQRVVFQAEPDFEADPRPGRRSGFIDAQETNAVRLVHGAGDGRPGWYVDRLGDYLLSHSEAPLSESREVELRAMAARWSARGVYHKTLERQVGQAPLPEVLPRLVQGEAAPERFLIRENGLTFELSFSEGYSVGLFLDQRDNRRRLLVGHVGAGFPVDATPRSAPLASPPEREPGSGIPRFEVLNVFAYTCAFSVAAARAGAHTTSLDLSKKYLAWGRRNFVQNGLDPAGHDFIYGDALRWLRRLARKGLAYDAVLLDPPTFSQSREHGVFRAEKDYGSLVNAALPLLKPGGVLFASTNAARLAPEAFLRQVQAAVAATRRSVALQHYVPQPPDFPICREEPAYLKTVWLRLA